MLCSAGTSLGNSGSPQGHARPLSATAQADVPDGLSATEWTSIRQQIRQAQYQVTWQNRDGQWAYRAPNRAQGFSVAFGPQGSQATGYEVDGSLAWKFGLALSGYGTGPGMSAKRARVDYQWNDSLTEWYENRPEGVKHGLTLAEPPPGTDGSQVELTFAVHGSLTPDLDDAGKVLRLRNAHGSTVLLYDQLAVHDANGRRLPAHFELTVPSSTLDPRPSLAILIDATGACYPLTVDPLLHGEVAILHASDKQEYDRFGWSVSLSGDTLVVGADGEDGGAGDPAGYCGAAYVFERNQDGADNWGEVAILHASDKQASDGFGGSVSLSGDTLVVGADGEDGGAGNPLSDAGAAYVFERNTGGADNWGQVTILRASDAKMWDELGHAVSISGDTLVVGAWDEDGGAGDPAEECGAAYTFVRSGGAWQEASIAHASDAQADDRFGYAVSISADTLVVGAYQEDGGAGDPLSDAGAAYVFARNTNGVDNWGEVTILRASDAQASDYFGYAVSISADTLAVGACQEDGGAGDPAIQSGAAYVFERNTGGADNWGQVTNLHASDAQGGDLFGWSVSISADKLVVGAPQEDGGAGDPASDSGAAYVFERNTGGADNWGQVTNLHASDAQASDLFGCAVSISADTLLVGADGEDGGAGDPAINRGAAYVFERNTGGADNWGQVTNLHATDAQASDDFGRAVSISGDTLVVGAYREDGGAGDPTINGGAAYVFERNTGGADNWGQVTNLHASDAQAGDGFGYAVSISADTLVVGALYEDGGGGRPALRCRRGVRVPSHGCCSCSQRHNIQDPLTPVWCTQTRLPRHYWFFRSPASSGSVTGQTGARQGRRSEKCDQDQVRSIRRLHEGYSTVSQTLTPPRW